MQVGPILDVLNTAGTLGVLVIILVSSYRGSWVWGKDHRARVEELRADRDEWKHMALAGTELADRAVEVAGRR